MHKELRDFLVRSQVAVLTGPLGDSESLLAAGALDSAGMVDLIAFVEKTYAITVDEDDMIPENFDSINALVEYIERKRGQA